MEKSNDTKQTIAKKAGDAIERLGEKIAQAGATDLGQKVRDAGDKIEHSMDPKAPNASVNKDFGQH